MGVVILPYNDIYKEAGALQGEKVLFEREKGNYALYQAMAAQNEIIDRMNPTSEAKAKRIRWKWRMRRRPILRTALQ